MKRGVIVGKAASGRISVSFPYNQEYIAKVKTIPGYKWYIRNASIPDTSVFVFYLNFGVH
jgi:hypothetical protein